MPLAAPSGSTHTYSLQDTDKELLITVLLCGMNYTALTTSLLAQPELLIQQVEDALKNKEVHHLGIAAAAAALSPVSNLAAPAVGSTCAFWTHCRAVLQLQKHQQSCQGASTATGVTWRLQKALEEEGQGQYGSRALSFIYPL
jgi:hypothetical protein